MNDLADTDETLDVSGIPAITKGKRLIVGATVAIALILGLYSCHRALVDPSTDDATIDAEVVHVAPSVGGRIVRLGAEENGAVREGDLLFALDPTSYQGAVTQAEADLALAKAALASQRRLVATQQSAASVAGSQIARAIANRDLAARTVDRLWPLAAQGYVPRIQLDQAETALRDANISLKQAREQAMGAAGAVDSPAGAAASVQAREAALTIARKALADTQVHAPHNGRVVGLNVTTGELVAPSQALFTLIDTSHWHAVANFRETVLPNIRIGDCATVYSLIDRKTPLRGHVDGIGAGVLDASKIDLPRSMPYVEKALNWVRVEQRFPVRILLDSPPPGLMRVGASAVVEIRHGAACS